MRMAARGQGVSEPVPYGDPMLCLSSIMVC
jgi:hypothetical protein